MIFFSVITMKCNIICKHDLVFFISVSKGPSYRYWALMLTHPLIKQMDLFTSRNVRELGCFWEPDGCRGRNNSKGPSWCCTLQLLFCYQDSINGKSKERGSFSRDSARASGEKSPSWLHGCSCAHASDRLHFTYVQFVQLLEFLTYPQVGICLEVLQDVLILLPSKLTEWRWALAEFLPC